MSQFARAHVPLKDNVRPRNGEFASGRVVPGNIAGLQGRPEPRTGVSGGCLQALRRCSHLGLLGARLLLPFLSPVSGNGRKCRRVSGATGSGVVEEFTSALGKEGVGPTLAGIPRSPFPGLRLGRP